MKTVCFTGHRPDVICSGHYDNNYPNALEVKDFLRKTIDKLIADGTKKFITGGALGVDQWAAEILVEQSGIEHTIALPYNDYGSNWPPTSQETLKNLCSRSKVYVVCEGGYAPYKNHMRNQWMVDHADLVVAVWNGSMEGGTASCVRYAKKKSREFIRYNPVTKREEPVYETGVF